MKRWIGLIGIGIVLGLGYGGYRLWMPEADKKMPEATAVVRRGTLSVSVSAAGTIVPKRQIEVKSKANGTILKMHVRDGDWVKKGQLLVELDKTDEETKVRQAESDLGAAQARVAQALIKAENAQRAYEQSRSLREDGYVSQEDLLKAASDFKLAEADLYIAKASLNNAQENVRDAKLRYADTEIRSPITGLVLEKLVEEGQLIASGISATTGGTPLLTIGDMSTVVSSAQIDEVDIGKVSVGQPVTVQVDAYGERKFSGTLSHISPKGEDQSNVTVFNIEIDIHDPHKDLLKPGMTNTAEIVVVQEDNVLLVPASAIRRKADQEGRRMRRIATPSTEEKHQGTKETSHPKTPDVWVFVKKGDGLVRQPVKVGVTDYEHTQILEGLNEGDLVLLPQQQEEKGSGRERNPDQGRNTMRAMRGMGGR